MSSPSAVVCREVFDENSQPSAEEVSEYAAQLGIDPESESHLLPLARDGLMQALPPPWKAYYDEKLQTHYYYNPETKKTQWEHPLDRVYRELVKKARDASMQDDTCASVQELPTSEENTKHLERVETKVESDEELSTDSENHQSDIKENASSTLIGPRRLAPLGRPPLSPLARLDKKLGELRISPLRRSADSPHSGKPLLRNSSDRELLSRQFERPKVLFKQQSEVIDLKMNVLSSPEEEYSPLLSGKGDRGLTLSGKGNMFLKLSKSDLPSPDTEKSLPLDSITKSDPPKGILREKLPNWKDNVHVRPKTASFEEDRKSVRFKLENPPEPTISPGSNSSSEQNDKQSSIISAAPSQSLTSHAVMSPMSSHAAMSPISQAAIPQAHAVMPQAHAAISPMTLSAMSPISQAAMPPAHAAISPMAHAAMSPMAHAAISPISHSSISSATSLGAIPPISQAVISPMSQAAMSPMSQAAMSPMSQAAMSPTSQPLSGIVLSPLASRPPLPPRFESPRESAESDSHQSRASPRRRVVRPPPGDYIKPDLFQKNFQKILDLVRPGDIETTSVHLEEPVVEKEARPRSPMIPQKSKISINLMESIESETSIDSPDREFANLDLNDLDDSNETHDNEPKDTDNKDSVQEESSKATESKSSKHKELHDSKASIDSLRDSIPQIKVPTLDLKTDDSRSESTKPSKSIDIPKSPIIKISPISTDRSPRLDFSKPWSPLTTFKPNKTPLKTDKGLTSPRLDGVIISQGKSSSDNVVVVYQFETQNDVKPIKSPLIPDVGRDLIERSKGDERRRLEISLQKELEGIRMEWASKERKMRAELQQELKAAEEKFLNDKRVRLSEQADRHTREMEEALEAAEKYHQQSLQTAILELDEKYNDKLELAERQHKDNLESLQGQYKARLLEQQRQLEMENERTLSELHAQLQESLARERVKMIEANRATIEALKEEHSARVADLRHDYRAEVERLRTQHLCHVSEVRTRLAHERAAVSNKIHDPHLVDKYRCLKEKYARLKHDVKMSLERRNKRREMSMTTGSETEKSNSHKGNQSLERCKELNETSVSASVAPDPVRTRPVMKCNDNDNSHSEHLPKSTDNNNDEWKYKRENTLQSADTSQTSTSKKPHRRTAVAFREPPNTRRRNRDRENGRDRDNGATTDCQDSSDATTADEKPKETLNGHGRRRCFTRLKSASTSRLNYSPKRGEGWSSPLESLRQQLRKLDDLEDQFPDLACQPAYSLRYPFTELGAVATADTPELEFVRHRALVEREGMRRARAVLKRRRAALRETRASLSPHRAPSEERESTELEVALHRARALLGEKEIRLRHIERALRQLTLIAPAAQEGTTSEASSCSSPGDGNNGSAGGAVLRSLRALHADVRDIWRALDARRPHTASPETSSCNAATTSQTRMTLSAPDPMIQDHSDGGVSERARGLRAWLQTAP